MDLVGDRRGQSIQIGAILLFAALIIAFASYQAVVVPNQNRGVEFSHNQQVQSQMQDLRNAIVSVGGSDDSQSVTVQLGTRYPTRLVARNPSPPSGSLQTIGTTDESAALTIQNAQATGTNARETGDFWNTSQRYNTGGISYRPNYNVYATPPTTVYEHSVLYNRFETGNITLANQSLVDGTDISLVVLNGTMSRSSTRATTVDVRSVSSSTERVRLTDDGTPINITFTSTRSAAYWDFLVDTQSTVTSVTNASSGNGFYNVSVELKTDETYSLKLTKVGVGSRVTEENAAYLTDVAGDGADVKQGETTELTLEVRDRFNNPPADTASLQINGSVDGSGTFESSGNGQASKTPDDNGQVTFTYEAPGSGTPTENIEFSYTDSGTGLNASTPQNVSMSVDVKAPATGDGGGGAYALNWDNPGSDNPSAALSDCSAASCTWDIQNSDDTTLTLRSGTNPALDRLDVEFAVNDTSVGSVSPVDTETDTDGETTTTITANSNGTVGVYAASGGASDVFNLTVENFRVDGLSATATSLLPSTSDQNQSVRFSPADSPITAGTQLTFDFDDAQSPGRVDYRNTGDVGAAFAISAKNNGAEQNTTDYEFTVTVDEEISTSETARVWVRGVDTGPAANQLASYDVTVTRGDTGDSATGSFSVGQNTGISELTNIDVSGLQANTNGQTQTITFEPTSAVPGGEYVSISLIDAEAPADGVDYPTGNNGDVTPITGGGTAIWSDRGTDNASIQYQVPSGGLTNGQTVEIDVTNVDTGGMSTAPYTVGFSRGDAGTTSTTFTTNNPNAIQFTGPQDQDFTANASTNEFTLDQIQIQDDDNDEDLDRVEYVITDSTGTEVNRTTVNGIGPAQYQLSTPLTFTGPVQGGESYTLSVTAYDADGNAKTVVANATAPQPPASSQVSSNSDATTFGGDTSFVQFSVNNGGSSTVTIRNVSVSSSSADILREETDAPGAGNREIYFSSPSGSGYYEAGDTGNPTYTLGTQEPLSSQVAVGGSENATITMGRFRTAGGGSSGNAVDMRGNTVEVTLGFTDGSSKTVSVTVPG